MQKWRRRQSIFIDIDQLSDEPALDDDGADENYMDFWAVVDRISAILKK